MTTMTRPSFVYVTYIATTQEKVWQAVTDPAVARQYWNAGGPAHENISDWKPGSRWEHQRVDEARLRGAGQVDIAGRVVESTPPSRLVLTWARPAEVDDESKNSRVIFEIEPSGDGLVRLTVTHENLERDAPMLAGISSGWPRVLSNLKTLLETGRGLPPST